MIIYYEPHDGDPRVGKRSDKLLRMQRILHEHRPDIGHFVDIYKDVHQHPELSCLESRTADVVVRELRNIGFDVTTSIGGHGVIGVLRNGPGKTILTRSEIDALPIEEKTGLPYASKVRMKSIFGIDQPVMHACGHDIHLAALLASLRLLYSAKGEWSGTVIGVFQPNEEMSGGARAMVDDGLYGRHGCPVPDLMLAQHVGMSKAGLVAVRTGPVLAASDFIELEIFSKGIGPNPPECRDPVSLASYLITRFQSIISSDVSINGEYKRTTLKCRDFKAGVPGVSFTNKVYIRLELKTTETSDRDNIFSVIKTITKAECEASSGKRIEASVRLTPRAPITRNDTKSAEALQECFGRHFGDRFWIPPMDAPVEDFANLSGPKPVPFVYWKLGSTDPAKWDEGVRKGGDILLHLPTNHSPEFAPAPELTIVTGMEAMSLATLWFLDGDDSQDAPFV
ncbi:uncharacterized protein F4822DRAFT_189494 [Hypoxylon trugodes]|uniref:uncharacterized protein n=1 Tax=Hypoxylon trugodes TaxID=326681 RepID=UPI00219AEA48|nr:uncharacterized protein F4822DRAFT_189494 [Hypoxylon trugodes]KAI1391553.1 hypothetical protein F4822DRAFT_189494 [Hypoxylon trugodes]